jgi:5-methylcytosine-specific restriction endonuclease McrA
VKFCPGCKTEKPFTEFSRNKRRYDGLTNYCKICWQDVSRQQYLKNREKIRARYYERTEREVPADPGPRTTTALHGTASAYARGCRCRPCTDAASAAALHNKRKRMEATGLPDDNSHRTRARRHGGEYQPVDRVAVFDRDGWICGLCGEPVDKSLEWPDAMSVSLDHVVPLSRGGDHSYANVQCAHLGCNQRKQRVAYEPVRAATPRDM